MGNFDLWLVEIQKLKEGRIWFNNFEFDKQTGNLSSKTLSDIGDAFDKITLTFTSITDPRYLASALAEDFRNALAVSTSSFDLKCERSPVGTCGSYAFAIPVQVFLEYYVKTGGGVKRKSLPILELLRRAKNHILKKEFEGIAKTSRAFFWATPTSNYDNLRKAFGGPSPELAREVHIRAGLVHRLPGDGLVEIRIPHVVCSGKRIKAPSVLDAGFPSGVFLPSDDKKTGYGWTLDLVSYGQGLEEVVIEALQYDSNCDADIIGIIPDDRPVIFDSSKLEKISEGRLSNP